MRICAEDADGFPGAGARGGTAVVAEAIHGKSATMDLSWGNVWSVSARARPRARWRRGVPALTSRATFGAVGVADP